MHAFETGGQIMAGNRDFGEAGMMSRLQDIEKSLCVSAAAIEAAADKLFGSAPECAGSGLLGSPPASVVSLIGGVQIASERIAAVVRRLERI